MAYKYSKGATVQGDIKAADDAQRDTLIDFGEDRIDLQTSGTVRFTVENNTITTTVPIHVSGSAIEGIRVAKGGSDYRAIVFEVDGQDNANISVSNAENFVIQNEMNGKDIQFWVNPSAGSSVQAMTIKEDGKVGIGISTPSRALDVQGDVMIRGNNILDNSGGNCITFDGSGNTQIDGNLSFGDVMLLELSVPNVDLQTDTYAHRIYAPYGMDIENVMYVLDSHNTSGNVTVTLTNTTSNVLMSSVTMAGTAITGSDDTITSASVAQGDSLTFAITEAAGVSQGLHAMLYFRRSN